MSAPDLPRVVLRPRKAQPFFYRHPWVFESAVARIEGNVDVGAEALLVSDRGDLIGRGLLNPVSKIRLRLYTWNPEQVLSTEFFQQRIDRALSGREYLDWSSDRDSAMRLVASEGDGLSGLTVDRFGEWLVVQLTSAALAVHRQELLDHLQNRLRPRGIILRTEKGIGQSEGLELCDGLIAGEAPPEQLVISENGLQFGVNLLTGQKTGFFLDQRDNRAAAARYLRDRKVLDLFCYSGGFGLAALKHGPAASVVGIDVSQAAIGLAEENAKRNNLADRVHYETKAAFVALEERIQASEQFDAVILDPPKMARTRNSIDQALKGYFSLNRLAVDLLPPGGILVTCSCSGLVSRHDFSQMLASVAMRAGRDIQILEARGAAPDHPTVVSCPESDYLQCFICRVL